MVKMKMALKSHYNFNSDVDDMGDPFSEDEADNPFSDGEQ